MSTIIPSDDAWRRFKLWLFRECTEGTRRHLWSLFGLPLDEITDHGRERHALLYVKKCLTDQASNRIAELQAEVERLNKGIADITEAQSIRAKAIRDGLLTIDRLRKAGDGLAGYMTHLPSCHLTQWLRGSDPVASSGPKPNCDCGLTEALTHWQEVVNNEQT